MGPLPFVLGAGVLALIAAAASRAKPSAPKPSSASATVRTPTGTTTIQATTSSPAATIAPAAYLSSVPYAIAMRVIQMSDPQAQHAQGVWLNDNGYPRTAQAVFAYAAGDLTDAQLRQVAQSEFAAAAKAPENVQPKRGTTEADPYGDYLLSQEDDTLLYSYALSSTSLPFVSQAAARLAAAGDTRAALLTQHLADLAV